MPRQIFLVLSFAAALLTTTKSPAAEPLPLPSATAPPAAEASEKWVHLRKAAEHLEAAGLPEQAAHFRKEAERAMLRERQLRKELDRKLAELERIRGEVHDLRKEIGAPQQIALRLQILELDLSHPKVAEIRAQMRGPDGSDLAGRDNTILMAADTTSPHPTEQSPSTDDDTARQLAKTIASLKSAGALKVLAEPEFVTTDGRPAHIVSGGEFPVPVPQPGGGLTMEWKEFGVRVEAVARALGRDRVGLEIDASLAERDFSRCVRVGEVFPGLSVAFVPGLTVTRANSKLELRLGEPAVLGGLIKSVGPARDGAGETREVETVIIVTPEACDSAFAPPGIRAD